MEGLMLVDYMYNISNKSFHDDLEREFSKMREVICGGCDEKRS